VKRLIGTPLFDRLLSFDLLGKRPIIVVTVLTVAMVALLLLPVQKVGLRHLGIGLAAWLGLTFCLQRATGGQLFGTALPFSIYLWIVLPLVGIPTMIRLGARQGARRAAIPVAAVLLLLLPALAANRWFGYFPTVRSIYTQPTSMSLADVVREKKLAGEPSNLGGTRSVTVRTQIDGQGRLVDFNAPAKVSGFNPRTGMVWLPPAWFGPRQGELPVVFMLAGVPGEPADWARGANAVDAAEQLQRANGGFAPVLVFPDINGSRLNDTECVDGKKGNSDTYLTTDVPAAVREQLKVSNDPRKWAVVGFSEGGTCATHLALRHPDVFRSFANLSGDISPNMGSPAATLKDLFNGDRKAMARYDMSALLKTQRFDQMAAFLAAGTDDAAPLKIRDELAQASRAAGITVQTAQKPGGHNFNFWRSMAPDVLSWLNTRFQSVPNA
jgi:pimeloyl-ACP methyl ester carboxylesterase